MHVIYPTTASNYFHALRRQMKRNYRKPLIVISPKTLLRLPEAQTSLNELADPNITFRAVYGDVDHPPNTPVEVLDKVKYVVLCSGKFYYNLRSEKVKQNRTDMAIIRVEVIFVTSHHICFTHYIN